VLLRPHMPGVAVHRRPATTPLDKPARHPGRGPSAQSTDSGAYV
jgi:hypothetical protein